MQLSKKKLLTKLGSVLSVIAILGFIVPATQSHAWSEPDIPDEGYHFVKIDDSLDFFRTFPLLEAYRADGSHALCGSFIEIGCADVSYFYMNFPLRVCDVTSNIECVSKFQIQIENRTLEATFQRYVFSDHPNAFTTEGVLKSGDSGAPAIWKTYDETTGEETFFLVDAGMQGGVLKNEKFNPEFYAHVIPVSIDTDPNFVSGSSEFWGNRCAWKTNGQGVKIVDGCSGVAAFGCVMVSADGDCFRQRDFDNETVVSLSLKVSEEPSGWFHGRFSEPNLVLNQSTFGYEIELSARPVQVPVFYWGAYYSEMSQKSKKYWDTCIPIGECAAGSRIANSVKDEGIYRNVVSIEKPYGDRALKVISQFSDEVRDQAVATEQLWAFRTLNEPANSKAGICYRKLDGLVGIVATNSVAYEDGAPDQVDGSLDYKVAGPHYLPDGLTAHLGTYDLVMRSDFARCLYGFSNAPVRATVQVIGNNSENIATTIVSEKDGWLKLAAYGFTFSEKEIKVKLTQPYSKTITKFAGSTRTLTSKQKAEIRATVAKAKNNPKFICTGVYVNDKDKVTAIKRARTACDYAKFLDKNHSYWSQAKKTSAKSYDARVMISSK